MNPGATRRAVLIPAVIALVLTWLGAHAGAEILRTNARTKLRARPGESERVVARLDKGREVKVLKRRGRWLRVKTRVEHRGKVVGWLTRTTVRSPERAEEPPRRPTRVEHWRRKDSERSATQRSKNKDRLVEVVQGGQRVFREPSGQARVAFKVAEGDLLTVVGDARDGNWLLVENRHGHIGWIPAILVTAAAEVPAGTSSRRTTMGGGRVVDSADDGRTWSPDRAFATRVIAGIGYRSLAMDFTSNGAEGLGNYLINSPAATAVVAASLPLAPDGSRLVATVDGEYRMTYAAPGIRYANGDGDISFAMHEAHAAGQLGVRMSDNTITVAARAGYHYGVFFVDDLQNAGKLPRESLYGLRVGGRVHYAPTTSAYVLRAGLDLLAAGTRTQTPGLEDGTDASASALWAHLGMDYPLTSSLSLTARYAYERASTDWTGQSTRQPDVTEASRVDQSHVVYVGMARGF